MWARDRSVQVILSYIILFGLTVTPARGAEGIMGGTPLSNYQPPSLRRAQSLIEQGKLEAADQRLEKLLRKYERQGHTVSHGLALVARADIRRRQNLNEEALSLLRSALPLVRSHPVIIARLDETIRTLELEEYTRFTAQYPQHTPYGDFIDLHPEFTILADVRKERDAAHLQLGKDSYSKDPATAQSWLLAASASEFEDISSESKTLLISLQTDFQKFLNDARGSDDLLSRATLLRGFEIDPSSDPKLNEILRRAIASELEQTEFLLYVVQRGDISSIKYYLSAHGESLATATQSKKHQFFSAYARSLGSAFGVAAVAEAFGLAHTRGHSSLMLNLSKGFAGGSKYWVEVFVEGSRARTVDVPYVQKRNHGETVTVLLRRGTKYFELYLMEERYPIFQAPETHFHSTASLTIEEEVTPLFNYVGVMNRSTGLKLCVKKIPAFAGYDSPATQVLLQLLEKYAGFQVGDAEEFCPLEALTTPMTFGDIASLAESTIGPPLGAGITAFRKLVDHYDQNGPDFGTQGHLLLITGSICGKGRLVLVGPSNEELECCGWGNLGVLSHPLILGDYSLSATITSCTGTVTSVEGIKFSITPGATTEVELLLESGSYRTRTLSASQD